MLRLKCYTKNLSLPFKPSSGGYKSSKTRRALFKASLGFCTVSCVTGFLAAQHQTDEGEDSELSLFDKGESEAWILSRKELQPQLGDSASKLNPEAVDEFISSYDNQVNYPTPRLIVNKLKHWYNHEINSNERLVYKLIALNVGIYVLSRTRSLRYFMSNHFTMNTQEAFLRPWTLLTCNFNHAGLLHLGFNMFALSTVGGHVANQVGANDFLKLYVGAGLASSLASLLYNSMIGITVRSLGSSGAVIAVFWIFAHLYPQSKFAFIFFPVYSFSAKEMLTGLVIFDILGLILRVSPLDHAAHLGGAAAGLLYIKFKKNQLRRRRYYW